MELFSIPWGRAVPESRAFLKNAGELCIFVKSLVFVFFESSVYMVFFDCLNLTGKIFFSLLMLMVFLLLLVLLVAAGVTCFAGAASAA